MDNNIKIKGARMHNLKNINLSIPHNQLTVITGLSGSGKSSLAFDTIFAEGQRQYIESLSPYFRQFLGQKKPAEVDEIIGLAPSISIDQKALSHNPRSTVGTLTDIYDYLRVLFSRLGKVYCPICGREIQKLSLDEITDLIVYKATEKNEKEIEIISPLIRGRKGEYYQLLYDYFSLGFSEVIIDGKRQSLGDKANIDPKKKHDISLVVDKVKISDQTRLVEAVENALAFSSGLVVCNFLKKKEEMLLSSNWTCPYDNFAFPELEPRLFSFNSPHGACLKCHGLGQLGFKSDTVCPECEGKRLKPEALSVKINKKNIHEVSNLTIKEAYDFFNNYYNSLNDKQKNIAENVLISIVDRLYFLLQVGLDYLTLSRSAGTLSGGEAQRIRLSSQIGSQLSRTLYVLDEPTIGLHEKDTDRLIKTLQSLKEKNNTVVVVEHDERTILNSDYLVDMGPLAGSLGGEVVASGETNKLIKDYKKYPESLTLQYLNNEREISLPDRRRTNTTEKLKLIGAKKNNLKNLRLEIPLRKLVGVSGVSGSGKSTLLYDVLYRNLSLIKNRKIKEDENGKQRGLENLDKLLGTEYVDRVVIIDQTPIGRTPRSNPATYTGIFTPIREFFAQLPEAKERAYSLSRFSFNRPGGRCEACGGAGFTMLEMHFLPPVMVECEVCQGRRFNRETLQIKYKGLSISDVLDLTIDEAAKVFSQQYNILDKLKVLQEVGLGYLKLGQSATTLSGGEAQRIKIAKELTQLLGKKTLYLLDEPSVGLHYYDIEMLLKVLNKLVEKNNSVLVIEHNLHILKAMDYIFDLGPGGGFKGGEIVAEGTPEEICKQKYSVTGEYLKEYLD
ncbi:excinuclease ABC subunit A [bacterium]|nr:excinuclease ABC subunit A [bacterium]